jgi:hypothetical protein
VFSWEKRIPKDPMFQGLILRKNKGNKKKEGIEKKIDPSSCQPHWIRNNYGSRRNSENIEGSCFENRG